MIDYLEFVLDMLRYQGRLVIYIAGSAKEKEKTIKKLKSKNYNIEVINKGTEIAPMEWRYMIYAKI